MVSAIAKKRKRLINNCRGRSVTERAIGTDRKKDCVSAQNWKHPCEVGRKSEGIKRYGDMAGESS